MKPNQLIELGVGSGIPATESQGFFPRIAIESQGFLPKIVTESQGFLHKTGAIE